jgi:hypothetical protein
MRNVSGKLVEKIKAHILFSIRFFFDNRAVCEIMWNYMVEPDRHHTKDIIQRMRFEYWLT